MTAVKSIRLARRKSHKRKAAYLASIAPFRLWMRISLKTTTAAAAANCHPCMDHHLAKCDALGLDRDEVTTAVKIGIMVNRGAENAICKKARELFGDAITS